jgi:hypothetical protein
MVQWQIDILLNRWECGLCWRYGPRRREGQAFLSHVTGREMRVHQYTSKSNATHMELKCTSLINIKCRQKSAGKLLLTAFWDEEGLLHMEFLKHWSKGILGMMHTTVIHWGLWRRPFDRNSQVCCTRACFLWQCFTLYCEHYQTAVAGAIWLGMPDASPHSPGLASCKYHLFLLLKQHLEGKYRVAQKPVNWN